MVLTNTFISHRRLRRSSELPVGEVPESAIPGGDPSTRLALLEGLRSLSRTDRAVLVLRFWEDRSVAQTAGALGISEGAVRTRTTRAAQRLRGVLDADFPDLVAGHGARGEPMSTHDTDHEDLVDQLVPGGATDVGGQGQLPTQSEIGAAAQTYATFTWTPATGGAGTQVMANVQNAFGDAGPDQSGQPFFSCRADRVASHVDRLDRLVVVSYERRHAGTVDRFVDVYHRDSSLRVVVASTNADEVEKGQPVRPEPPLSTSRMRVSCRP